MVFILKSFCCCFQTQSWPVVLTMLGSVFQMSTLAAPVMKQHLAVARMARMLLLVPTVLGVLVNMIMITASVEQTYICFIHLRDRVYHDYPFGPSPCKESTAK